MAEVQNDPDRVLHPLRRVRDGEFERVSWEVALGEIAARIKRIPRLRRRLVHGQPRRLLLLARAVGEGLSRRDRLAALLHGRVAGREQPLRGERAAVRVAARGADPRPQAHPLPAHGGGQPARLARVAAVRAAGARAAARDRPRGGGRPPQDRDRAPVRAPSRAPGQRRLPAAVADRHRLRGGPRRPGVPGALGDRGGRAGAAGPGVAAGGHGGAHRGAGAAGARPGPRLRRRRRRRRLRAHRILPGPLRHTGRLSARRPERGDRQRRPARRLGVREPAGGGRGPGRAGGARHLRQDPLPGRRLSRRDRKPPGLAAGRGDRDGWPGAGAGPVRVGRQPGAVGPQRRRAGAGDGVAGPVRLARPVRQRDQPPRRLRPAHHDLLRARRPADRVAGFLHHAVRPVHGPGDRPARRVPPGVGDHR